MTFISSEDADAARRRRRLSTAIREALRELSSQLSLLNHHVGARVELKDVDLDCLDLISRPNLPPCSARSNEPGVPGHRAGAGGPAV